MKGYVEITREMIEGCLDDEIEIMFDGKKSPEWFKNEAPGTYEEMFQDYLNRNNIKEVNGRFYEPDEDYFAAVGLAPDGRPLPDDKLEPPTFGDR